MIRTFDEAMTFLASFTDWEQLLHLAPARSTFDLGRLERLLQRFGDPHRGRPVIHVTGTKGKSSVTAMADAVLRHHGIRTLRFLSPHVRSVCERLAVDGHAVGEATFARLTERLRPEVERLQALAPGDVPSFFECITVLAFLLAQDAGVDALVMEVGLGGRLDATNVVDPTVSVITSIALEHTRILGDTEEAIAIEKAGIIKPGRPVLTGLTPADPAYRVVAERAATLGCPLQGPGSGLDVTDIREVEEADGSWVLRWSGRVGARSLSDMTIPEGPRHQVWNALLAAAAAQEVLKSLGRSLDPDATRRALSGPSLPGRCTWIAGNPPLLIDGAHTAGSVAALVPVVLRRAKGRPVHLLCGLTRDRDPAAVLSPLWDVVASVTATRLPSPRSHPPEALIQAVPRSLPTEGVPDAAVALSRVLARALSTGGIVLVTGSLYLAGDVLGTLESQAGSKGPLRSPHDPRP